VLRSGAREPTPAAAAACRETDRDAVVTSDGPNSAELLQEIADGDLHRPDTLGQLRTGRAGRNQAPTLDAEEVQLAQIAALAAVDASPVSWFVHLGADEPAIGAEKALGALIAVAPIIGTPRLVAAAANIIGAMDLAAELEEELP
jgi:hypothetical protein